MKVFEDGRMYFAASYRNDDIAVLREEKPPNILASFAMWRNDSEDKHLKTFLKDRLGYEPEKIVIDSGAYTFRNEEFGLQEMIDTYQEMREEDGFSFDIDNEMNLIQFAHWSLGEFEQDFYNQDKNQFCLFQQYLNFLFMNHGDYNFCFAFDRMGDNEESKLAYRVMNSLGLNVIPVYQAAAMWGNEVYETKDFHILDYYAAENDYIAIGGTAITKVKGYTKRRRIEIIRNVLNRYPDKKFHLLGTLDPQIVEACPELYSFDGQCWLKKTKKERKLHESADYVNKKLDWFETRKSQVANGILEDSKGQLELLLH